MVNIKKLFAICICTLLGGFALGSKNCSAHQVSLYFGKNNYEIKIDGKNYYDDYSLVSSQTFNMLKCLIGIDKTIEMDDTQFKKFIKLFDVLSEQLEEISNHSDYNSDDYIPFTSEIEDSLNEKYIKLFRFIKKQIL